MPQTIQCPTCSKKFRLPDRPPATFACTGCATVMDLSGFAAAPAAPAAAPAAPTASSRTSAGVGGGGSRGASSRGSSSRGASSRESRVASGGAGRSRSRRGGDDEEGGDGGRGGGKPKSNNALLIGSLIGVVVLGGIAFLMMGKKDPEKAPPAGVTAGGASGTTSAPPAAGTSGTQPAGVPAVPPAGMTGESSVPATPEPPKPDEPKYVSPNEVKFEPIDHHPEATAEERAKIDELVQKAVYENAGSDSRVAGNELVKIGVKAAPRLVNVFCTVKMGEGFDDRLGKVKAAVAENLLRRIDGWIERTKSPKNTPLKGQSDSKWVEKVARWWVSWWLSGKYTTPHKPWDERIDGNREEAPDGPAKEPGPMGGETPDGGK